MNIQSVYESKCNTVSDINEHLPILKKYADCCEHITEFGVRLVVSTWAFLAGKPKKLISYDKEKCDVKQVEELAKKENIDFTFIRASTLEIDIEPTDFLFIDTLHVYDQLKAELRLHSNKAKKYIAFHDTANKPLYGKKTLMDAINEFLEENSEWKIVENFKNNNGLVVISRID